MLKNYLITAWRNLRKNKGHSLINISGLAIGMMVAMLIGLWIWDELTFDTYGPNYRRVAQVMQTQNFNGAMHTGKPIPVPLGAELRKTYGGDFKRVVLSSWCDNHILTVGETKLSQGGNFMEPGAVDVLGLQMIEGTKEALSRPNSILLSQSLAKSLFGNADAINKTVRLDNQDNFSVAGIFADLPHNSTFFQNQMVFIAPWTYYANNILGNRVFTDWGDNSWQIFVELADNAEMAAVSRKIKYAKLNAMGKDGSNAKPELFLHPMSKWHLYSKFKDGAIDGGRIQYVWLFGTIGLFVLLLACINFMNLSTARSEKRAKEVGIRKTVGSLRSQLIGQFFCESILVAALAFALSLLLAWLLLPFFNTVAAKQLSIPWHQPFFWAAGAAFVLLTGLIAGSYPALYLSSFRPIKVLKGSFKAGRLAAVPRQVLVVLQFSVSVILIIGTIVVFRQIEYAKDRPVGYDRAGLVIMRMATDELHKHAGAFRDDLLRSDMVAEIAESNSPTNQINHNTPGVSWEGKDPTINVDLGNIGVTSGYGKTVGWQFVAGRDFSAQLKTDSNALVLNEAAAQFMGFKDPIGKTVRLWDRDRRVIGVIKDMVLESPFEPVKPIIYWLGDGVYDYMNIRITPDVSTHEAIATIGSIFKKYVPSVPFEYRFADDAYAIKFADEERVGKLAGVFALLAISISCLGLFGMASFMAEQRIKEIGVRKVLGASVVNLWGLLSKDFLLLVLIALVIALPLAGYFMHGWLQHYTYRTGLAWWIFVAAGAGAIGITLLTVSYQSIKAAMTNPVKSLRSE